ncbi:MAG TPA: FAD-dependent oxidoreductase [Candidatus Bilamarchaeaceae archaeon]|nr:FAD-dependent oxidoreductase [Candidatus Bilamarchaeaceae archaeon]
MEECEILVIGAGPAGLTAALYAARGGRKTCVLERGPVGGQLAAIAKIENWPGDRSVSGPELGKRMADHAAAFGARIIENAEVLSLDFEKKIAKTTKGDISFKALIIASGAKEKKVGIPGENELHGRGVSYCATCDAAFFKGKVVAVVGGGNSAMDGAATLSKFASKVYLIHRRERFRAEKAMQAQADRPNIEKVMGSEIISINGKGRVQGIIVRSNETGQEKELNVDGVFFFMGQEPSTDFLSGELALDKDGYITANERMETSLPLVYAAGDVRSTPLRQVSTAASDGSIAAVYAEKALSALKEED